MHSCCIRYISLMLCCKTRCFIFSFILKKFTHFFSY
nr:MAG TPA: hypothetical protein [Caudoviricetes sp.]